jgi:hypothetical protein
MERRVLLAVAVILPTCLLAASCGTDSGTEPGDGGAPTVTATSPADGATDCGLIERIEITFSEDMDASTINDTTLVVETRGIEGHVDYDASSRQATFIPDAAYPANGSITITVTDDVADEGGAALAEPYTSSFETGVLDCAHLVDYLEPNDTIAEAAPIETDRTYYSLTTCEEDRDVFEFSLQETAMVIARTRIKHCEPEPWAIYLRRSDGTEYGWISMTTALPGATPSMVYTFLPGTYYAEVLAPTWPVYFLYDLEIESGAPCPDDAYEDNDFMDEAASVLPGEFDDLRGCYQDRDFYSLDVPELKTLSLTIDAEVHGGLEVRRYELFDPSGQSLAFYQGSGANPVTIDAVTSESGTHYVMVRFFGSEVDYDMDIAVLD